MTRIPVVLLAFASLAAACGDDGGTADTASSTSTTSAVTSTTAVVAATSTTTTTASTTASPTTLPPPPDGPWGQADLPALAGVDPKMLGAVALVRSDDVLNARLGAGVDNDVYAALLPGVMVERTGMEEVVSGSVWAEINTNVTPLWVNTTFLAAVMPPARFVADDRVGALLNRFEEIIGASGDLSEISSRRGLYVSHHDDPVRFRAGDLPGLLTDPTTIIWASTGASADEMAAAGSPGETFADAIGASFVSAYSDTDTVITHNSPSAGGNGRLPDFAIPFEFTAFNYVTIHDPGDDPTFGGLDWVTWYVSIDYENGAPVIVGLTIDEWSP